MKRTATYALIPALMISLIGCEKRRSARRSNSGSSEAPADTTSNTNRSTTDGTSETNAPSPAIIEKEADVSTAPELTDFRKVQEPSGPEVAVQCNTPGTLTLLDSSDKVLSQTTATSPIVTSAIPSTEPSVTLRFEPSDGSPGVQRLILLPNDDTDLVMRRLSLAPDTQKWTLETVKEKAIDPSLTQNKKPQPSSDPQSPITPKAPIPNKPVAIDDWVTAQPWFKQLSASMPKGVTPGISLSSETDANWKSVIIREIRRPESGFDLGVSPMIGVFRVSSDRKTTQWLNPISDQWLSTTDFLKSRHVGETNMDVSPPTKRPTLAANELSADIDNDGKWEMMRWKAYPSSTANKFYQLSVIDDNGSVLWKSLKTESTEHAHAFFESDFGISLPELLHDITGDGFVELITPVPQSDVSATYYRILSWQHGVFKRLPSRALMLESSRAQQFTWKGGDHSFGIWVSEFGKVSDKGLVTAQVTSLTEAGDYQSGTALLRFHNKGASVERWLTPLKSPSPQVDNNPQTNSKASTSAEKAAAGMFNTHFSIEMEYSPAALKKLNDNNEKLAVSLIVDQYGPQYMEEEAIATLDQKFTPGEKLQFQGIPFTKASYEIKPGKRYRLTITIFSATDVFKNNIVEVFSKNGVTDWDATQLNGKQLAYVCRLIGEDYTPTTTSHRQEVPKPVSKDSQLFLQTRTDYKADKIPASEAFATFMMLAKRGQVDSMNAVGSLYLSGDGVQKNTQQAMRWFKMAADKGNNKAMFAIGYMYDHGEGVSKSLSKAREWFLKAANAGHPKGAHNMGYIYANGEGVKKNKTTARKWYLRGSQLGNPKSMCNLGNSYYRGDGGKQNLTLARQWLICSATRGIDLAANSLGVIYRNGNGVKKDPRLACQWFAVAIRAGYDDAESSIQKIAQKSGWKNFDWKTLPLPQEMIDAQNGKLPPLPE